MPRYASRERQRREVTRHRDEILQAALRVFAERGFQTATMRDVARAADFSVGKLYLHFPGKEALYKTLVDRHMDDLVDLVEDILDRAEPAAKRIERIVRETLTFLAARPFFVQLFVNETLGFELRMEAQFGKSFAAKYDRMIVKLRRTFEEGLAAGDYAGASAEELTLKLSGIYLAVVTAEARRATPRSPDEIAASILRLFYESPVRAGRGTQRKAAR